MATKPEGEQAVMTDSQRLEKIEELLLQVVTDAAVIKRDVVEVKELSQSNSRLLRGNGDMGVVARIKDSEDAIEALKTQVISVESTLHKCFYGDGEKPGLLEDVRKLKDWRKNLRYWYVLLVGALVVGIANLVLQYWFQEALLLRH